MLIPSDKIKESVGWLKATGLVLGVHGLLALLGWLCILWSWLLVIFVVGIFLFGMIAIAKDEFFSK